MQPPLLPPRPGARYSESFKLYVSLAVVGLWRCGQRASAVQACPQDAWADDIQGAAVTRRRSRTSARRRPLPKLGRSAASYGGGEDHAGVRFRQGCEAEIGGKIRKESPVALNAIRDLVLRLQCRQRADPLHAAPCRDRWHVCGIRMDRPIHGTKYPYAQDRPGGRSSQCRGRYRSNEPAFRHSPASHWSVSTMTRVALRTCCHRPRRSRVPRAS
jgi:hypothetical protein